MVVLSSLESESCPYTSPGSFPAEEGKLLVNIKEDVVFSCVMADSKLTITIPGQKYPEHSYPILFTGQKWTGFQHLRFQLTRRQPVGAIEAQLWEGQNA